LDVLEIQLRKRLPDGTDLVMAETVVPLSDFRAGEWINVSYSLRSAVREYHHFAFHPCRVSVGSPPRRHSMFPKVKCHIGPRALPSSFVDIFCLDLTARMI
jgi:hypothetical protein